MLSLSDSKRLELLGEVVRISSSLRQNLEDVRSPASTNYPRNIPQVERVIPELILPFPQEVLLEISTLQIPVNVRESILESFRSWFLQVQQEYTSSYRRTCLETTRSGSAFGPSFADIRKVYQACSERHFKPMVREYVSVVLTKVAEYRKSTNAEERRSFNPEYTPFLEKYFEYNAYPSAQHQYLLAEKSRMTRRQIEVWFQNHRNRAKKDEAPLRRNATDLPLRMALKVLQDWSILLEDRAPSPSDEESGSEEAEEEDRPSHPSSCIDAFDSFRPRHAFPNTYSPVSLESMARKNGALTFPSPAWMRKPAASGPVQRKPLPVDMDELAKIFHAKLNIFEGIRRGTTSSKSLGMRSPWYAATLTVPCRAPLPALVRPRSAPPTTTSSSSLGILSFRLPAGSSSQADPSAFLKPRSEIAQKRKISPLPRRVPMTTVNGASSLHRPISRMSSFSSECSSSSRSSSSSRHETPEPSTPPQSPASKIPAMQGADYDLHGPDELDFHTLFGKDFDLLQNMSPGNLDLPQAQGVYFMSDKDHSIPTSDPSIATSAAIHPWS